MVKIPLLTKDGGYVSTVLVLPMNPMPEILVWGSRSFVKIVDTPEKLEYREGLAIYATQTLEEPAAHDAYRHPHHPQDVPVAAEPMRPQHVELSIVNALIKYVKAQRRVLEKWADGDENVRRDLLLQLHNCEMPARDALSKFGIDFPAADEFPEFPAPVPTHILKAVQRTATDWKALLEEYARTGTLFDELEIPVGVAVRRLCKELQSDHGYYYSFQANIAMACYDEAIRSGVIDREDKLLCEDFHKACNKAAMYFLDLLISEPGKGFTKVWSEETLQNHAKMKNKLTGIFSDLNDINTDTPEGQYFFAALAIITTTSHTSYTPWQVIEEITVLKNQMFGDGTGIPLPGPDPELKGALKQLAAAKDVARQLREQRMVAINGILDAQFMAGYHYAKAIPFPEG